MLLGDECTRGCRFCNVKTNRKPEAPDPFEPMKVALAVKAWGVDYIVLTSVDRDDLEDHGSAHFAQTVEILKSESDNKLLVECLVGDMRGDLKLVEKLADCGLDVFAHNVETVERLQRHIRDPRANYKQSLAVLKHAKLHNPKVYTKTSIMLGLGESEEEVIQAMVDLRASGVDIITFGQYLRPTEKHLSVVEYITPEIYERLRLKAEELGFLYCASGAMVRSSYKAGEFFIKGIIEKGRAKEGTASEVVQAEAGGREIKTKHTTISEDKTVLPQVSRWG